MSRIIGIDYGTKRVGIASTDPLQIIASPLTTLPPDKVIDYLINFLGKDKVECFVIGDPINLDDTPAPVAIQARLFVKKLKKHFPDIPVCWEDERYTSKMAARAMIEAGYKKKERQKKENLDMISAAIILQSYLDRK